LAVRAMVEALSGDFSECSFWGVLFGGCCKLSMVSVGLSDVLGLAVRDEMMWD